MALRKLAFMLVLPLAAAVALAQEPPQPQPEPEQQEPQPPPVPPAPQPEQSPDQPQQEQPDQSAEQAQPAASEPETTGTREISAEVVSSDAASKSINVKVMIRKDASTQPELKEAKIRVDEEAVDDLSTVQPGQKVKLLCRMNGNNVIAVKDIKTP